MSFLKSLSAALFVFFFIQGGFAMIETLTLDDLVIKSDFIAVASLKSSRELGKTNDFTNVENILVISEILKGEGKAGDEITVDTLSGFEDEVIFKLRRPAIIFLFKDPQTNRFQVTNAVQGYWPLDDKDQPTGMGTGISKDKVLETIRKTKDMKPNPASAPVPEF